LGKIQFKNFDLAAFAKKTFGMYGGRDESITLLCHESLAGVIVDRFGKDIMMIPAEDNYFKAKVLVSVSRQFFGWVTELGELAKIQGPEQVKEEYKDYLQSVINKY